MELLMGFQGFELKEKSKIVWFLHSLYNGVTRDPLYPL